MSENAAISWGPRLLRTLGATALMVLVLDVVFRVVLPRPIPAGLIAYGMVTGCIYALVAVGLVLVYRANRVINFALAEVGIFGAVLFEDLDRAAHVPWLLALLAGVGAATLVGFLLEVGLVRRFFRAPRLILTVATIGMATVVAVAEFGVTRAFGRFPASAGLRTPLSHLTFSISGVNFDGNALLLAAAVPATVVALGAFLRRTAFGVATRASAENADRAALLGVPVKRVSTVTWVVAAALAGTAAILRAPVVGLVAGSTLAGPSLLLRSLTAAVIARMEDTRLAVLAGLAVGIIEQALFYAYGGSTISDVVFVVLIVVALLVQRPSAGRLDESSSTTWADVAEVRPVPRELRRLPEVRWARVGLAGAGLIVVLAFPSIAEVSQVNLASVAVIYAMVAVSLVVLTGWSGHISLGQFGLVALGAAISARLTADAHWDLFAALIVAGTCAAAVSVVLGAAAVRLRGYFFAVTSLGFAVAIETFFLNTRFFSGLTPTHRPERPVLLSRFDLEGERAFYFFCIGMLVVVVLAVRALRRSRTGRVLIAVRDNDRAAQSYGIRPVGAQLSAFAVAGFIAGTAGGLFAAHQHAVSPAAFAPAQSIAVFSMAVIGGMGSLTGAILGAAYVRLGDFVFPGQLGVLTTGLGLLVVLLVAPGGLGAIVFGLRDRRLRWVAARRGIVVASLVADVRVEDDAAQPDAPAARAPLAPALAGGQSP